MKNKLFILLLAFVLLLSACSNNSPPDDNTKEVLPELESAGSIESRGEKFIENFPQDYPSFELLEYVFGSAENAPIQLVAIARNKETGSSATLFVLDENGVGQVVLASGYSATYCKEDGLQLDKNVISISLNLEISSTNSEIHDFNITVTQEENQGKPELLHHQKFFENGTAERAKESGTEQNYNMIDGCVNNVPKKPRRIGGRWSVLDRLHIKQAERRQKDNAPQQEQERSRKS